jgi:hypothetical protein
MKRHRIILQLQSEEAQAIAARADQPDGAHRFDSPDYVDGYWAGRQVGLAAALTYLKETP